MRYFSKILLLLAVSSLLTGAGWRTAEASSAKARVLLRMIKFVEWPEDAFAGPQSPLTVCVEAHPRLMRALRNGEKSSWRGREIIISPPTKHCHVRVLGSEAFEAWRTASKAEEADDAAATGPTLLVSDRRDFLSSGGHVRLSLALDTVQFDINATQARQDQLHISAELLGIARKVQ